MVECWSPKPKMGVRFSHLLQIIKYMEINKLISEALGEFHNQYDLAKEIVDETISMVKTHQKKNIFSVKTENQFKKVIINIEYSEDDEEYQNMLIDMRPTSGTFDGVNDDTVAIKFFISRRDVIKQNDYDFKKRLYHIAVHELNHGYVILNQAKYNEKGGKELLNPLPLWYNNCIVFLQEYQKNDIAYQFVQSLYACHEKEMKAIISETTPHIENYVKEKNVYDKNTFIEALKESEPFQRYYTALYVVLPEAKQRKESILNVLKYWGFDFDEHGLERMFIFIERKSKIALKYIEKNAMLYYHEHIKLGDTNWFKQ